MTELKQAGFGGILRRRREELGLSLDDVAASTRVRKTYLQALEEENLRALPGAAYVIGFLRIYARQLGLAVDPLLASMTGAEPGEEIKPAPMAGHEHARLSKTTRSKQRGGRLIILLVVLLLSGAIYLYLRQVKVPGIPQPVAVSPVEAPSQPPILPQPQPAVSPPPVAAPSDGGEAEVTVIEFPVIPREGAVVRMLPVAAGVLKVSLDNQETREYQLQPDQSLNWKVSRNLAVELSAPGLVRIWVDQQELAVADALAYVLKNVPRKEEEP